MPSAPRRKPPPQQSAATKPALRGPTRSSQPPQSAAESPSTTMNSVNVMLSMLTDQSQVDVKSSPIQFVPAGHATGLSIPIAFDSGSQNTLKPYAMPIQRCMHSAAGGTSQRLKPAGAIVRSFARIPVDAPADGAPRSS